MVGEDIRNSWEGKKEWRLMGEAGKGGKERAKGSRSD